MHEIITKTVSLLELSKPYKLVFKPKLGGHSAEYYGMLRKGKLVSHVLRFSIGNMSVDARNLDTLIVHEFIHAWQAEKGLDETHGPFFKKMAKVLGKEFNLPLIYIKGTDV